MQSFKSWLQNENLAGPGGGPNPEPDDQVALATDIARKGAGAFQTTGDNPPRPVRTATSSYLDPRFAKGMRKYMKKDVTSRKS